MSRKSRYYWACRDGYCVQEFPSRENAEEHVRRCRGVLVVSRDGRPWEEVALAPVTEEGGKE